MYYPVYGLSNMVDCETRVRTVHESTFDDNITQVSHPLLFNRCCTISIRWVALVGPLTSCVSARRSSFLWPRGRASGQTYRRIAVIVDNCCAWLVFCWLISVGLRVPFSFILCVFYFIIKFIKYNDWYFPSLGRKWTPHRVERETRQVDNRN